MPVIRAWSFFVTRMRRLPHLVHGEEPAKRKLAEALAAEYAVRQSAVRIVMG